MSDYQAMVNEYVQLVVNTLTGQEGGLIGHVPPERLDFEGCDAVAHFYKGKSGTEKDALIDAMRSIIADKNLDDGVKADLILLARSSGLEISELRTQVQELSDELQSSLEGRLPALMTEVRRYLRDVPE